MALRAGIVGMGGFYAKAYGGAFGKIDGVQFVAAAHLGRPEPWLQLNLGMTAPEYAARYGVRLYEDPAEMIRREGLDLVCICDESRRNSELGAIAARAGAHIFLSKPFCTTLAEADRVIAAAREAGVLAGAGSPGRFDPVIRQARARMARGDIGAVTSLRALLQHNKIRRPADEPDRWYFDTANGGVYLAFTFYVADLLLWLSDYAPIERAYGEYSNLNSPESPYSDSGKFTVRFRDGRLGSADVVASLEVPAPLWEVEAVGTEGFLRTQQSVAEGFMYTGGGTTAFGRTQADVLLAEMEDWVAACRQRRSPDLPIDQARRALALCLAWKEASGAGRPVTPDGE